MTTTTKVLHQAPADSFVLLKPQKLGSHYHKVPQYIAALSNKNPKIIPDYFLLNFRLNIDLCQVFLHEQFEQAPAYILSTTNGTFGFSIDHAPC
jgi:flagellar motor switch protein FliM